MCQFNSGCPGIEVESGFFPCTDETGCVSGVYAYTPNVMDEDDECLTVTLDLYGRPCAEFGLIKPPYQSKYITI